MKRMALCSFTLITLLGPCDASLAERNKPVHSNTMAYELGMVQTGEAVRHVFSIRNSQSDKPMEIKSARTSCECVQILSYPHQIAPGETSKIEVRWTPLSPGRASHDIWLDTNRPARSPVHLRLKGWAEGAVPPGNVARKLSTIPGEWVTRITRKLDRSLLVLPDSVHRDLQQGETLQIVDIRSPEAFQRIRIPGSLNIALFAIQSKLFLKSSRVVLVGTGHDYGRLETECRKLRELGFAASTLEGGMHRWSREGRPVEGTHTAEGPIALISPQELFEERHLEEWMIVNACRAKRDEGITLIPQAQLTPETDDAGVLVSKLEEMAAGLKRGQEIGCIVFDDNAEEANRLARALREKKLPHTLVLEGGIEGYRSFLEQQAALRRSQTDTGKEVEKRCSSCPQGP